MKITDKEIDKEVARIIETYSDNDECNSKIDEYLDSIKDFEIVEDTEPKDIITNEEFSKEISRLNREYSGEEFGKKFDEYIAFVGDRLEGYDRVYIPLTEEEIKNYQNKFLSLERDSQEFLDFFLELVDKSLDLTEIKLVFYDDSYPEDFKIHIKKTLKELKRKNK